MSNAHAKLRENDTIKSKNASIFRIVYKRESVSIVHKKAEFQQQHFLYCPIKKFRELPVKIQEIF